MDQAAAEMCFVKYISNLGPNAASSTKMNKCASEKKSICTQLWKKDVPTPAGILLFSYEGCSELTKIAQIWSGRSGKMAKGNLFWTHTSSDLEDSTFWDILRISFALTVYFVLIPIEHIKLSFLNMEN